MGDIRPQRGCLPAEQARELVHRGLNQVDGVAKGATRLVAPATQRVGPGVKIPVCQKGRPHGQHVYVTAHPVVPPGERTEDDEARRGRPDLGSKRAQTLDGAVAQSVQCDHSLRSEVVPDQPHESNRWDVASTRPHRVLPGVRGPTTPAGGLRRPVRRRRAIVSSVSVRARTPSTRPCTPGISASTGRE